MKLACGGRLCNFIQGSVTGMIGLGTSPSIGSLIRGGGSDAPLLDSLGRLDVVDVFGGGNDAPLRFANDWTALRAEKAPVSLGPVKVSG